MHSPHPIAHLALAALLIPAATAQSPAAQTPPAASAPLLHANANLVLVDVVVTDKGNAVRGLDRSRFHVFEDGHEQPITAFDEHQPPAATADSAMVAAGLAKLPPHTYTNIPIYPDAGAVNVLLLDGLNTPMANQQEARRQMIQYMGTIKPGTTLAIFTLGSQLRMVEGFTTNVARLTKALENKKASSQQSPLIAPQNNSAQMDIENEVATMADLTNGAPDPHVVAALLQFEVELTVSQTNDRVRLTLDAMQQLARYLSAIPGRKNLIWFSGSFPIVLDPNDTANMPLRSMQMYSDEIRKTSELLAASRVAVYPVDARGMMTQSTVDVTYTPSPNGFSVNNSGQLTAGHDKSANIARDNDTFMNQTLQEHTSMQQLAEETGGAVAVNTNGLKEAVANAVENGASYYTIGYVPPDKKMNGHFHRLKLAVDNNGYKLAYRTGYYADSSSKPNEHNPGAASAITSATLHGAPPATEVIFKALVLAASDPALAGMKQDAGPAGDMTASLKGPLERYMVGLEVDPHTVSFDSTPDGSHAAQLEFVLVAYDADGKRINSVDRSFAFNLKPDRYAVIMQSGIRARLAIDLPAGLSYLRIAVQDLTAGHAGALEVPVMAASK